MGSLGFLVAITPDNWRWTLLVVAAPSLFGLWVLLAVPESVRWLRAKREHKEATAPVKPMREVFRPPILGRTLLGIALGAIPVIGTAANGNWLVPWSDQAAEARAKEALERGETVSKPDAKQKAKTQMIRSAGGILGSLLGGVIAAMLGRRLSYFLISLGALAASTYIFTQLDPSQPWFPIWTFVLGFISIIYFGWLPLFLPELFPTRVRSTGSGIAFNTGRVVSGIVVLTAGFLLEWFGGDYPRVGFATGLIYAIGMLIIWLAPRRSRGLED
jgi:MFS family permease